jgi:hypothetical protein
MNCPHCQKELPDNYGAVYCPFCGRDLIPDETSSLFQPTFEPKCIHWPKFFIVLLTPAICCFLALAVDIGGLAVLFGLIGGVVSGLVCARMIMAAFNPIGLKRSIVYFGLAMLLCGLSFFLCFVGCVSASTVSRHGI